MDAHVLETVLLVLAIVALAIWRQTRVRALDARSLLLLPALLAAYGAWSLARSPWPGGATLAALGVNAVLAALLGLWRGMAVRVWTDGAGRRWGQGGRATLARWGVTVAARIALDAGAALLGLGVDPLYGLPLVAGVTLAAQNLVVWRRALRPDGPAERPASPA